MQGNIPEFLVHYVATGVSGRISVIGRCGDVLLWADETFDTLARYKRRKYPEELNDAPILELALDAAIRIDRIEAFGRDLPMLGQCMAASLAVSGEGVDRIEPGMVLAIQGERPARDRLSTIVDPVIIEGSGATLDRSFSMTDGSSTMKIEIVGPSHYRATSPTLVAFGRTPDEAFEKARGSFKRPIDAPGDLIVRS